MDIRNRSTTRSWTVCKYIYISEINIHSLRHPCRESLSTHRRGARWSGRGFSSRRISSSFPPFGGCHIINFLSLSSSWNHRSGLQEVSQFATPWASSCPAATRYKLTLHQSILTTACSAVVRKSQCGRVSQFFGAYNKSSHVGCLAVAGSLNYHAMRSWSGRSLTRWCPSRAGTVSWVLSG